MRRIVLSGVNFVEAGPLAIFKDALEALVTRADQELEIVALVHKRDLFDFPAIQFLEFPNVKRSWIRRLYFEYIQCKNLSLNLNADLWFCMHDITANVKAGARAVYCHNPAPFGRLTGREVWLDPRFAVFHFLYSAFYRINLDQNDVVVVQQQWMKTEFNTRYSPRHVLVAHPSLPIGPALKDDKKEKGSVVFFYPAFPRCFKNVEMLLEAGKILSHACKQPFEIWVTMRGDENRYAQWLYKKFGSYSWIRWMGALSRDRVQELYAETACLVFPSRLETWGLPLTEFSLTGKPILAIDLEYSRETLADYHHAHFFSPEKSGDLAAAMGALISGTLQFEAVRSRPVEAPFVAGWKELFDHLFAMPHVMEVD